MTAFVWGALTAISGGFFVASTLKFFDGGFIPMLVGVATFVVMATWRWGRKATFAAYEAKSTMSLGRIGRETSREPGLYRAQRRGDVAEIAECRPKTAFRLWRR